VNGFKLNVRQGRLTKVGVFPAGHAKLFQCDKQSAPYPVERHKTRIAAGASKPVLAGPKFAG